MSRVSSVNSYLPQSQSVREGKEAEVLFESACVQLGMTVTHSTHEEDMREHWDFLLGYDYDKNDNKRVYHETDNDAPIQIHLAGKRVDVKGRKRIQRTDDSVCHNADVTWLEIQAQRTHPVQKYTYPRQGWVFATRADYIAFMRCNDFLLVPVRLIKAWCLTQYPTPQSLSKNVVYDVQLASAHIYTPAASQPGQEQDQDQDQENEGYDTDTPSITTPPLYCRRGKTHERIVLVNISQLFEHDPRVLRVPYTSKKTANTHTTHSSHSFKPMSIAQYLQQRNA